MGVQYSVCTAYDGISFIRETDVNLQEPLGLLVDFLHSSGEDPPTGTHASLHGHGHTRQGTHSLAPPGAQPYPAVL